MHIKLVLVALLYSVSANYVPNNVEMDQRPFQLQVPIQKAKGSIEINAPVSVSQTPIQAQVPIQMGAKEIEIEGTFKKITNCATENCAPVVKAAEDKVKLPEIQLNKIKAPIVLAGSQSPSYEIKAPIQAQTPVAPIDVPSSESPVEIKAPIQIQAPETPVVEAPVQVKAPIQVASPEYGVKAPVLVESAEEAPVQVPFAPSETLQTKVPVYEAPIVAPRIIAKSPISVSAPCCGTRCKKIDAQVQIPRQNQSNVQFAKGDCPDSLNDCKNEMNIQLQAPKQLQNNLQFGVRDDGMKELGKVRAMDDLNNDGSDESVRESELSDSESAKISGANQWGRRWGPGYGRWRYPGYGPWGCPGYGRWGYPGYCRWRRRYWW